MFHQAQRTLSFVVILLSVAGGASAVAQTSPAGMMAICVGAAAVNIQNSPGGSLYGGQLGSLEAWASFPPPPTNSGYSLLFGRGGGGGHFYFDQSTGAVGVWLQGGPQATTFDARTLAPGWHHVALVYDSGTTTIYIDAVWIGSLSSPVSDSLAYLGGNAGSGGQQPMGWGAIDEVRAWSTPRSASEIATTMNLAVDNLPGLLASWHFDGNYTDSTGQHHGSPSFGPFLVVSSAPILSLFPFPCPSATCLQANTPIPIGGSAILRCASPRANAPIFVLGDVASGAVPLGIWGTSHLVFSTGLFVLSDPSGQFGPSVTTTLTDAAGRWTLTAPVPPIPGLNSLVVYLEAYVLDFFAPNGLFHQSNLLTVTFN